LAGVLVTAATLGGGCLGNDDVAPADPVLAVFGESDVRLSLFLGTVGARSATGEIPRSGSGFEEFRDRLIWDLVFEGILMREASRRGFSIDESDVEAARLRLLAQAEDATALSSTFTERFGDIAVWERRVRRRLLAERAEEALREELAQGERFEFEEIVDARMRFRSDLTRPVRLRALQLFAPNAEPLDTALSELGAGRSYTEVAEANSAVDMGWMSAAQAPDLLTRSMEGLAIGDHTQILRSSLGYHIFILTGREPAARLTGEAEALEIQRLLKEEAVDIAIREWLAQRAEALQVTVHAGNVAQLRCCRLGAPYLGPVQQEVP
jgi:hypothetical protein